MRLFRHLHEIPSSAQDAVLAIGNFDGVHLGHQAIIQEAGKIAIGSSRPLAVMSFEPHPRQFFRPLDPPFRLTTFTDKFRLLKEQGVELLFCLPFNRQLASVTAVEFVEKILTGVLRAGHIVVGYDFIFGHRRQGNAALLQHYAEGKAFGLTVVPPVTSANGEIYSSTKVREALMNGDVKTAQNILGRSWHINGFVRHGDKRGRELGFPTANISLPKAVLRPAYGVYAVWVKIAGSPQLIPGAANFGRRPTIAGAQPELLEVHLLDFSGDLYGQKLEVAFQHYLRPEARFNNLEELRRQIGIDCQKARALLA
ncbi:MAG: bifunctional riboflavin kinase/FAD synthetase [Dongiaceae bacterium]